VKKFFSILGIIAGLAVLVIGGLIFATIAAADRIDAEVEKAIAPVVSALKAGRAVDDAEITRLARDMQTRSALYRALVKLKKVERFPEEDAKPERIAEADLALWLSHPHEMKALPDHLELVTMIERQEGTPPATRRYYLFKYRMDPPHFAAEDGWMAGMAGPYAPDGRMLEKPTGILSEFKPWDSASPEEHLNIILGE